MSTLMEVVGIGAVVVGGGGFALWRWGLLGKVNDTAQFKANQYLDAQLTPLEKMQLGIDKLAKLLEQQGDAVTDLDAELATQSDRLKTLQTALDGKVSDLHDTPIASPGDAGALQRAAMAVSTAEAALKTQADLIEGLKGNVTRAHDNYNDSLRVFNQRKNELPAAQASAILTKATKVGTSIAKQNEAFTAAAAAGNDAMTQLQREQHKAEAEAALHGPSTDDRNLAAMREKRAADDVLARYGIKPADGAAPAAK